MRREKYKNPCLTMHQPWASLLVHGIKRIEGRSWPAPIRGRLLIHAASKVPDETTIKAMEEFYREIYAIDGITDIQFPQHYPVSRLIGCVEVVGCVSCDELQNWDALSQGVRLEAQTNFCWLCEKPQKLIIPFEMRGYQGVYNLENKIHVAAVRGLAPCQNRFTVKFPLPDPKNPGSVSYTTQEKKPIETEKLAVAIAGARAAAIQFTKKGQNIPINVGIEEYAESLDTPIHCVDTETVGEGSSGSRNNNMESNETSVATKRGDINTRFDPGPARIMAAAIRNLKPSS